MRHLLYIGNIFVAVLFCICVASCSEGYSSPLKGQSVEQQVFETGTNIKTITIGKDDLSKCTVSSNVNWCSATIQGASVIISVQPNDTYDERQAIITLNDPEDATTLSFIVVQNQNDAILVDTADYTIPEKGGDVNIMVQSNVNYTVEIPENAPWLTMELPNTRGLSSSAIILRAERNSSGDERSTIVSLKATKTGTMTQIFVNQDLIPTIIPNREIITFYEDGGEFEIKVYSNIALNTTCSENWISSNGRASDEGFGFVEKFKVSSLYPNQSSRDATITFSDKLGKWDINKAVLIRQEKSLSIVESDISIYVGNSYELTLNNILGKSISWKSSDPSIATVNSNGVVKGVSRGTATITATTADGKCSDEIKVTVKDVTVKDAIESLIYATCSNSKVNNDYIVISQLYNKSQIKITVNKCTVYENGTYLYRNTNYGTVFWGSVHEKITNNNYDIRNNKYTFVWEYTYNGKTYTCISTNF